MNELLHEILAAREQRVQKQRQLLEQYATPLLCFTMNIPGPVKFDRDVSIGFHLGNWLLKESLKGRKVLHFEASTAVTGCEAYYAVDMPAKELKKLAVELEEIDPIGRLFDMDVLLPNGQKISREELGYPRRKCLLCDQDAYLCAGRRTHSAEQLRRQAGFYLYIAAREYMCEYIATRAYFALNQEVSTTPKPGLVDGNNTGAHKDMDIRHFFASANALRPYFCDCAEQGFLTRDLNPTETMAAIRPLGLEAEQTMRKATRGVNTHKGAIFSMGILCAALGRLSPDLWQPERLLAECAAIAAGVADRDLAGITPENAKTAGERLYAMYGITGVRGQAQAGFPAVRDTGLPVLRRGLEKGLSLNDAGAATLLHLIAATDDTNLIHRGGREKQLQVKEQIAQMLKNDPFPPKEAIEALDKQFILDDLSPGGSADLLALTYFLFFLQ